MSAFRDLLAARSRVDTKPRTWIYVPYDQLTDRVGPLARGPADEIGIVLVKSAEKARRRPYHKQKLALVLANMRWFALEQAALGRAVRYRFTDGSYADALREVASKKLARAPGGDVTSFGARRRPAERPVAAPAAPGRVLGREERISRLDHVVKSVWNEGYSHHISRLMVLSNIASLLDVEPRELTDWFWVAYVDAYDWVVEPVVLAMGSFGAGDVMTTKPYVAGAGYISRMSDFCGGCRFSPKACPLTSLYWAYLERHAPALSAIQRMKPQVMGLKRRSDEQRAEDRRVFDVVTEVLSEGREVTPAALT